MTSTERLTASFVSFRANDGLAAIFCASAVTNEELRARDDVIDHAEPMRLGRAPDVCGEQEFLGLARTEFPGELHEPFDAADAHRNHGIAVPASLTAMMSQAQASIKPCRRCICRELRRSTGQ